MREHNLIAMCRKPFAPTSDSRHGAYLAVILDGFSRRAAGWALARHLDASLAGEALDQALADREPMAADHSAPRGFQIDQMFWDRQNTCWPFIAP